MKKRILLVCATELCVGGVPKVIMTLVEELHKEYIFDIATLSTKEGYFDKEFLSYGGKIYRIPTIQYINHRVIYPISFLQIRKAFTKIFKNNQYEAVHCHSGYLDGACQLAAAKAGVPIRISHGHGTYVWTGRNVFMKFYFWFGKRYIRKYATVRLACSSIAGDTLFLGAKFENILNPVAVSQYAGIEKIPHEGINLLQIGYFDSLKNQKFSLRLLSDLRKKGVDVTLSLIGYTIDSKYMEQMNHIIEQETLGAYVTFLSHDFNKRDAFAQADFCILPSTSEGLPLVALESQAACVPCLMSDNISSDSDVGAGFFIQHDDIEKWASTIINGVKVDNKRLVENLQKLSTQAYADKIRNIYEQKDI